MTFDMTRGRRLFTEQAEFGCEGALAILISLSFCVGHLGRNDGGSVVVLWYGLVVVGEYELMIDSNYC